MSKRGLIMVKMVCHVHTKYSYDSTLPFWLLYMRCVMNGITHITITEHNTIEGAIAFKRYCERKGEKVQVIVGEEIMTTAGEIIGLFLKKNISGGLSPEDTISEIKKQGGIVYVPHPYDEKRYKTVLKENYIEVLAPLIDCIEVHNGRNISPLYDMKQNEIAEKYNLRKVIGGDIHTFIEIGKDYIVSDIIPDTPDAFIKSIDSGRFVCAPCIPLAHKLTVVDRIISFIQRGDFYGLYRIVVKRLKRKKL